MAKKTYPNIWDDQKMKKKLKAFKEEIENHPGIEDGVAFKEDVDERTEADWAADDWGILCAIVSNPEVYKGSANDAAKVMKLMGQLRDEWTKYWADELS